MSDTRPRARRGRIRRDPAPPPLQSTDLSVTGPPARVAETNPLKAYQRRELERERQSAALLNVFEQMSARLGGILALDQATAKGDVLGSMSGTIPANGIFARGWKQAAAAVVVANHSAADVIVAMSGLMAAAPSTGSGIFRVPPGVVRVLNVRGTEATIYGAPGALVDLVALVRPREPFAGTVNAGPLEAIAVPAGSTTSQTVTLAGGRRTLAIVQNVTAAGPGTLTTTVNGVTASGYVYPLLVGSAIAAPGTTVLRIGPGLTPAANAVASDIVPRQVQIAAVVAGGAVTYGIDLEAGT